MELVEDYDYFPSLPFIDEFENPFENVPFIDEMEENYGKLWQFKNCVRFWTLGVSRFKNYVYLLYRESNRGNFLPLNLNEKVILLESFYQEYVVITFQAVDSDGTDTEHIHSIVVRIGKGVAAFDINGGASSKVGVEACSLNLHNSRQCIQED